MILATKNIYFMNIFMSAYGSDVAVLSKKDNSLGTSTEAIGNAEGGVPRFK